MARNVLSSTAYRQLDVDAFDPDKFIDGDEAETPVGLGPDDAQVRQLLQSNQNIDALKAALANPPLRTKNQDKATSLVVRVLTSFKSAEMETAVKSLTADEMDRTALHCSHGMRRRSMFVAMAALCAFTTTDIDFDGGWTGWAADATLFRPFTTAVFFCFIRKSEAQKHYEKEAVNSIL
uniref:Actin-related protein 2/3 complex subunit 5 n=1 Tax=Globodera rostochiensis TaxID=31243 RepID=A0A914I7I0_GLORO